MVVVVVLVVVVVMVMMFTAISKNVAEVHDGTYRVVISSRPSAPQLSQHIPCIQ